MQNMTRQNRFLEVFFNLVPIYDFFELLTGVFFLKVF